MHRTFAVIDHIRSYKLCNFLELICRNFGIDKHIPWFLFCLIEQKKKKKKMADALFLAKWQQ